MRPEPGRRAGHSLSHESICPRRGTVSIAVVVPRVRMIGRASRINPRGRRLTQRRTPTRWGAAAMVTPSRVARRAPSPSMARDIRSLVIEHSHRANVGHIGSSLSIAEILAVLYGSVLKGRPGEHDRDRLVLSKGHAAPACSRHSCSPDGSTRSNWIPSVGPVHASACTRNPVFPESISAPGSLGHGLA